MKQYINDSIVEPVRSTTTSYDLGSVHYLLHCAVFAKTETPQKYVLYSTLQRMLTVNPH